MGKKAPGQIRREIVEALGSGPPEPSTIAGTAFTSTSHSAKALSTLAMMGTDPAQWQLTPIEWIEEEREVPGMVECPVCRGGKFVRIVDGQVVHPPPIGSRDGRAYRNEARGEAVRSGKPHGNCPRCGVQKRGWGTIPQGKIKGTVRAKVMVGYPRFPPGTRFDSRFAGGLHCNLCNKLVTKSRRVPVHATGDDGVTHGMFVGEDCAQKFLDVKLRRGDDSIMEIGNA